MCYHLMTYVQYSCEHHYPDQRHYIDCNSQKCTNSKQHRDTEHNCAAECEAIMLPDQHLIMTRRPEPCHVCQGVDPPAHHGDYYETDSE
ncbi:uncharacterized protein LAESUDRAFT_698678 [Laetiporus sulphureus 93-53]|uniref:Uncharacterized protein n=1 Tax=Laetiporus sulphureus 93-53 TaxID=1314785 RepID=A0A165EMV4_9APHY|nr:uncharacterized protein LAESUDRAFT_698678 [Laetiporus sulphureus 93-53]KZT07394.1 hypothetical protein LAESUDRAFT_698678 [Laetiporus sulphureus 93-53]